VPVVGRLRRLRQVVECYYLLPFDDNKDTPSDMLHEEDPRERRLNGGPPGILQR